MIPAHNIFWRGVFPFVPAPLPYQSLFADLYTNSGLLNELWIYPEPNEGPVIRSPVGPGTAFPFQLTKDRLAWFIYKAKTWQVSATGSYDFTVEDENSPGYSTKHEAEFSFDFEIGRNIAIDGAAAPYYPHEKDLLRPFSLENTGGTPLAVVPIRSHEVTYSETVTQYFPDSTSSSETFDRAAALQIFYQQELGIEPVFYPPYAWTPSAEETGHIGSYMKKDSDIACNLMVQFSLDDGFLATGRSFATLSPNSIAFGEEQGPLCNVVIQVPWEEQGIAFPLYQVGNQAENSDQGTNPITLSDITFTPTEFWEYQPPE